MFSVDHFLNSGLIPWAKVLSGESTLSEKPIEHVCVTELPVGDFVRQNELVLSTAVGCDKDDALMLELIAGVCDANACALLLTNPNDCVKLPQACMDYIQEREFPVIQIPWECRFADLLESVLNRIRDDAASEIAFYEEIQKKLLTSYLSNSEMDGAAQILAESFRADCAIFDVNKQRKGVSHRVLQRGSLSSKAKEHNDPIHIRTSERLYGYIDLVDKEHVNHALFSRYLTSALILWFDKEVVIQTAKQGEKDDFVWQLAKEAANADKREEIVKKGQLLGFNLLFTYTCVVGRLHLDESASKDETAKWISSNINSVKEEILSISNSMKKHIMLTYQQDLLIVFVENSPVIAEQHIHQFIDKIEEKFASVFPRLLFSWGISEISIEMTDFHECYLHAKLAQELCPNTISRSVRYSYQNTIIFNMLSVLAADEKIKKDSRSIIQPIIEHDLVNQTNLLHTLKIYLQLKNVSETARTLHLHRQSLLYRVNKIEELTGLSLKDSNNAFLLEVCVRLYMKD